MPSALDYLGITPPSNPLAAFFPQAGGDDAFRSQLEERPAGRSRIPPELALASQLPDPSGFLQQVQQFRGQNEAKQAIGELQNLDFGKPGYAGSVAKLLSKYPNAAQSPAVQKILQLKEFSGKQAADTKYSSGAAQAAKGLLSIPEDAPDYDERYQKLISGLDPEVLTHPRFASFAERGMHNSAMVRSKRNAQEQEKQMLAKQARGLGINPSKYDNLDDLNEAVADHMAKVGQRKDIMDFFKDNPELRKEYAGSMSQLRAPTVGPAYDEEKMAAVGVDDPKKMTPELWTRADALAKQQRFQKVRALNDQMMLMGINPLSGLAGASEPASGTMPPTSQSLPEGVSAPSTGLPQELLPPGAAGLIPQAPPTPESFAPVGVLPAAPQAAAGLNRVQQVAQQPLQEEAKATSDLEAARAALSPKWTAAKQAFYSTLPPNQIAEIKQGVPQDSRTLAKKAGKNPDEVVFVKEDGLPVTWRDVANEAINDPSFQEIVNGKAQPPVDPKTAALRAKYQY